MNNQLRIFLISVVALSMILLMTSMTEYIFKVLPDSLNTNMDINARDIKGGYTPLMLDAAAGNLEHARTLIAQGADLNARSANKDMDTALNVALINVNNSLQTDTVYAIAKLLIESGANIHLGNARGEQPVHVLTRMMDLDRRMEILDMIVARGADINAQTLSGETMLHISVSLNSPEWFRRLANRYGQILNLKIQTNEGLTVKQVAEKLGHIGAGDIGEVLDNWPVYIGYDLNIKAVDGQGRNGLMLAIIRGDQEFVQKMVQSVISLGINVPERLNAQDSQGNTALHYAVLSPRPVFNVRLLLLAGAPVNISNKNGDTPLMLVPNLWRKEYRKRLAQMLLDKGANPLLRNIQGYSAVALADQGGDRELLGVFEAALNTLPKK